MSLIVVLDAGPLGMASNPNASPETDDCQRWLEGLLLNGARVCVPEIADYEIRRELLRAGKIKGLARLDALKEMLEYLPLTTPAMRAAAEFWARARRQGRPATSDAALDGDMILAAQATLLELNGGQVIVATTNVRHLELFIDAREWQAIR